MEGERGALGEVPIGPPWQMVHDGLTAAEAVREVPERGEMVDEHLVSKNVLLC